ncbi:MAG: hypothetical protein V7711_06485 [Pseudomonadales bacterium]
MRWLRTCTLLSIIATSFTGIAYGENISIKNTQAAYDIELDMSDPALWTIDTVHLGTRQLDIDYDPVDQATVITPKWSRKDLSSNETGISNVEHSKLHIYQLIPASDCTQVEVYFEIMLPNEYVSEGKLELVFSLQAGAKGDYLFNGRTFTMADFVERDGQYTKLMVKASDFNEPAAKQRQIERVNFVFHRKASMISEPIKIRRVALDLNSEKITPPAKDVKVKNPHSYYQFSYTTQPAIDEIVVRISEESMDITRELNDTQDGMALIPQWKEGQIPVGHSGKVTVVQPLGAIHDFERFEVQYALNIPEAYFTEGELDIYLFVQAGEAGYDRWSGTQRSLSSFSDKAGQDLVLTMTEQAFLTEGKKRNQIEVVGLQLNRHNASVTEPITLKSITVKLPD